MSSRAWDDGPRNQQPPVRPAYMLQREGDMMEGGREILKLEGGQRDRKKTRQMVFPRKSLRQTFKVETGNAGNGKLDSRKLLLVIVYHTRSEVVRAGGRQGAERCTSRIVQWCPPDRMMGSNGLPSLLLPTGGDASGLGIERASVALRCRGLLELWALWRTEFTERRCLAWNGLAHDL